MSVGSQSYRRISLKSEERKGNLRNRVAAWVIPVAIFVFGGVAAGLVLTFPVLFLGESQKDVWSQLYLWGPLGQIAMFGPMGVLYWRSVASQEPTDSRNGITSLGIALAVALTLMGLRIAVVGRLMGGTFMGGVPAFGQAIALPAPSNLLFAMLVLIAYGPVEAVGMAFLIRAFDRPLNQSRQWLSGGVVITALLWGLGHIGNIVIFGWDAIGNALLMVAVGIGMGLLFKGTRSSLGPMAFWTLTNGTVL